MRLKFLNDSGKVTISLEETRFKLADKFVRSKNPKLADWLWNTRSISYQRYWEIALAALRKNVHWTDIKGMDLSDGSEVKTITLIIKNSSRTCTVGGLKNKTGNLHIVVYDPCNNDFHFVLLTHKVMKEHILDNGKALRFSFPRKGKVMKGWQKDYMVSFDQWIHGK